MKLYSVLRMGDYHSDYCEDYLFTGTIGNDKLLFAVMDGCTHGKDCYFISTLAGKLLRKIAKETGYKEMYASGQEEQSLETLFRSILKDLFRELKQLKSQLMLEPEELLTTLIMLLYDKKKHQGMVLTIGDGMVSINGQLTEYDQENKPDYIGFHLSEDFDSWYEAQEQKISFGELKDVSIATDGIFMFSEVVKKEQEGSKDALDFLVRDLEYADQPEMLAIKLKRLERDYGLKPTDDLALIRIIAD